MYTADTSFLLGDDTPDADLVIGHITAQKHGEYSDADVVWIVGSYYKQAPLLGLSPFWACIQMIHETDCLRSALSQRRWTAPDGTTGNARNPAGIGVTSEWSATKPAVLGGIWAWDADRRQWRRCITYSDWTRDSIPDHLGRLCAYAYTDAQATPLQRNTIARSLARRTLHKDVRGTARTLKPLGAAHNPANKGLPYERWVAGWAWRGEKYGANLATLGNGVVGRT